MKKLTILLAAAAFVAMTGCKNGNKASQEAVEVVDSVEVAVADNSQTALDYSGIYKGTLPCADCSGIETTIVIDSLGNFDRTMKYLGGKGKDKDKEFKENGKFIWDATGTIIEFQGQNDTTKYLVGENNLVVLDKEGKAVTGELAASYILTKQAAQ